MQNDEHDDFRELDGYGAFEERYEERRGNGPVHCASDDHRVRSTVRFLRRGGRRSSRREHHYPPHGGEGEEAEDPSQGYQGSVPASLQRRCRG